MGQLNLLPLTHLEIFSVVEVKIDIKAIAKSVRRASENTRRMRPVWDDIGNHMVTSTMRNFEAQGRPTKWARLAKSTTERKARRFGGKGKTKRKKVVSMNRILQDTGRLKGSVQHWAGHTHVEYGSNLEYAAAHQYGRGRMPARPYLVVHPADNAYIVKAIERHIFRGIRR